MLTQIISNCGCCGVPCCTAIHNRMFPSQYNLLWSVYKSCYYSNYGAPYTLRELGFPYKTPFDNIVTLELLGIVSCFQENGFKYQWTLAVSDNGALSYAFGDINEEGVLVNLPTEVTLFCRYGSIVQIGCSREAITTTTTTTTTTQEP